jgi:hypothetical protein
MATTSPAREAATATDPAYEGYQFVTQLFGLGMADLVKEALKRLQDPQHFAEAVRGYAVKRGMEAHPRLADSAALYKDFWELANGITTCFSWKSSSGVPVRSSMIGDTLKPVQPPERGGVKFGGFGVGLEIDW